MASELITYAKAGGPPDNWLGLRIFDRATGREIGDVAEVNTAEGWLIRAERNKEGRFFIRDDAVATERIEGDFEIRLPDGA